MNATFSEEKILRRLYNDIEAVALPILKKKAGQYRSSTVGADDLIQEGRIALFKAMTKYRYDRGNLAQFVNAVVDNAYKQASTRARTKGRMPRASFFEDGQWVSAPSAPIALEDLEGYEPTDAGAAPDFETFLKVSSARTERFLNALMNRLDQRDRDVLNEKLSPSPELEAAVIPGEEVKQIAIARHLGLTKNQVDHSLFRIRFAFGALVRDERFSDLFAGSKELSDGTLLYVSRKSTWDHDFVDATLRRRGLDRSSKRLVSSESVGNARRDVVAYSWGSEVYLSFGDESATLVVVGRLNFLSGVVFGSKGMRERLKLPWYGALVRALKNNEGSVVASKKPVKIPECFSNYDVGDTICDGDKASADEGERKPCGLRDRCAAFRHLVEDEGADATEMKAKSQDSLLKILDEKIVEYGIVDGAVGAKAAEEEVAPPEEEAVEEVEAEATEEAVEEEVVEEEVVEEEELSPSDEVEESAPDVLEESPLAVKKKKARKPYPTLKREILADGGKLDFKDTRATSHTEMRRAFRILLKAVEEGLSDYRLVGPNQAASPGTLFIIDRSLTSLEILLCAKSWNGGEVPVFVARLKPKSDTIDVYLRVPADAATKALPSREAKLLAPRARGGRYPTLVKGVDVLKAPIVAKMIEALVASKALDLPLASL
jgi:RNA polymerase sigma factor (sigma-70 family)